MTLMVCLSPILLDSTLASLWSCVTAMSLTSPVYCDLSLQPQLWLIQVHLVDICITTDWKELEGVCIIADLLAKRECCCTSS
jgi:hypothetical protein